MSIKSVLPLAPQLSGNLPESIEILHGIRLFKKVELCAQAGSHAACYSLCGRGHLIKSSNTVFLFVSAKKIAETATEYLILKEKDLITAINYTKQPSNDEMILVPLFVEDPVTKDICRCSPPHQFQGLGHLHV